MKDTKKVTSDDELHPSGRGKPHKDLGRQVRTFQGVSTANIVHSAFWSLKGVPITRPHQKMLFIIWLHWTVQRAVLNFFWKHCLLA